MTHLCSLVSHCFQVWSHAKFKLCHETFLDKLCKHAAKLPLAEGVGESAKNSQEKMCIWYPLSSLSPFKDMCATEDNMLPLSTKE